MATATGLGRAAPGKPTSASDHPLQDWPSGPKRHDTRQLSGKRARHAAWRSTNGLDLRRHMVGFVSAVDRPSVRVADDGRGATRAGQNGVPLRVGTSIQRFVGLASVSRHPARGQCGLICPLAGVTVTSGDAFGKSRLLCGAALQFASVIRRRRPCSRSPPMKPQVYPMAIPTSPPTGERPLRPRLNGAGQPDSGRTARRRDGA